MTYFETVNEEKTKILEKQLSPSATREEITATSIYLLAVNTAGIADELHKIRRLMEKRK